MEKRFYYIAGKTIEISIGRENDKNSPIFQVSLLDYKQKKVKIISEPKHTEKSLIKMLNDFIREKNPSTIDKLEVKFKMYEDFKKCIDALEPMLLNLCSKTFRNPYPAADTIIKFKQGIVLVYRKNPPSGWAIPGGFINYGESAEEAAIREAKEETGLTIENLKLFGVFSDPKRDPRFHTISIAFTCKGKGELKAGDDASKVKIFTEQELPKEIAFDHRKILRQFFKTSKKDMKL